MGQDMADSFVALFASVTQWAPGPAPRADMSISFRESRTIVVMDLCLAVSTVTFLIALSALVVNGPRTASFYVGIMATILPCLLIDIFYFVVQAKPEASVVSMRGCSLPPN
ncbi:hypothetical protein AMAG_20422 [Allomyces macrogynus ATCC 38327]|uniref:Uncharacterized protein n=1 Tax=Allomyces macrogynus (strain ATCC 38327) TaxID=578462 RepID=A0A0L0TBQ1_ALLM3|nr:hypothetical protein AMAG_20422 [Allomyces macrogynus ATCC 38327]|eukprot:KNE71969.1 hypothetical protein AMAG_20422 [Allomyces macrogynus ATCC 38327]